MNDDDFIDGVPLGYLITFRTYGTWLHGDERSSVDRHGYNKYGGERLSDNQLLEYRMLSNMKQAAVTLTSEMCACILDAIAEVCAYRGYEKYAIHVRTNHVHAVIGSASSPEKIINELKSYATRRLREANLVGPDQKVWARGGSRRYLWKPRHIDAAIEYVAYGQGGEIPDFK